MAESESETSADPSSALLAAALAGGASRAKVDQLLDRQIAITDLQIEELRREDSLRHWSLRVHHVSDVLKLSFEFAVAVLLLGIVALLASAVWTAANDRGLVIEAFAVPPDMAARGLTGQVVASQLLDRLVAMQNATTSSRPAQSYANNWGDDIKVQIPDTGVSIGEFNRYLHTWLGHQTQITGEVYRAADGRIVVTARAGGGGATVAGREADFDSLMQQAAEGIYRATQPYRYAIYEAERGNESKMTATLRDLVRKGNAPRDRAWAYVGLSVADRINGNVYESLDDDRKAVAILPDIAAGYIDLAADSYAAGHEEEALSAARTTERLLEGGGDVDLLADTRPQNVVLQKGNGPFFAGVYGEALSDYEKAALIEVDANLAADKELALENGVLCLARLHEGSAATSAWRHLLPSDVAAVVYDRVVARIQLAYALGQWTEVLSAPNLQMAYAPARQMAGSVEYAPLLFGPRQERAYAAYALAETGNLPAARSLIAQTPLDCDECMRIRGKIDALAHNWNSAARWFSIVSARSPDVPFADSDWGMMLLSKGDFDGAIAKFDSAHRKGPQFADPLEMWGEALIRKNRSDLALAEFEEADKYAPNWGRLHLKWGEALLWSGNPDDAKKQFAIAAGFDLTPSEKSELERVAHG